MGNFYLLAWSITTLSGGLVLLALSHLFYKFYVEKPYFSLLVGEGIKRHKIESGELYIAREAFWDWGLFSLLFWTLVFVATSNAVNLTDGLDGLAILITITVAAGLGIVAWATSNYNFASYLYIPYVPLATEMIVACVAIIGAGLGFLWFNTYPAEVFMGDVGSLSLGATLGMIAVLIREELLLFIMGGIFVLETISVILQVGSFRLRGVRIFRMAPIHHHFEKGGWPEPRVIVRFWIVSLVLVLLGLVTLKLR